MKNMKVLCFFVVILLFSENRMLAQTFWTESFQNVCASGCLASGYIGPNGAWSVTNTGGNGAESNTWFVSGAECGNAAGVCGTDCGITDPSLHVGSTYFMYDPGAAYLDGSGFFSAFTDRRSESPTIDCLGKSNITLDFNYIENGWGATDNATLWYYDGTTWSQLVDLPKTAVTCGGGQGLWTNYNLLLPASANNNANVKIGFRWINNDDGSAADPSFAVDDITLTVPVSGNPPVASFTSSTTTVCENGCVDFTDQSTSSHVGGITNWDWDFGDGNNSNLQNPTNCYTTAGTYTVTLDVTDANGVDDTIMVNYITVHLNPTVDLGSDSAVCSDAIPFTLDAGAGFTYLWTGSSTNQTLDVNTTGTYFVTISDGNSCTATDDIDITVNANPIIDLGSDSTVCADAVPVTLDAGSGFTYLWTGGSINQTLDVNTTGTYFVTISDGNSCTATDDIDITVNANPIVDLGADSTICADAVPVNLDAGAGFTYLWTGGSTNQTLDVNITGTYSVTISDGNTCTATDDVDITVNANPVIDLGADSTICADAAPVILDAGAGFTYLWTGGSTNQTLDVNTTGTYFVTITKGNSCTATDDIDITVNANPIIDLGSDSTVCADAVPVTLDAGSGFTYLWTGGSTNQTLDVNVTGTYFVTITDGNTCTATDDIDITVNTNPVVDLGADSTICADAVPVTLDAGAGFTYLWTGGSTNQILDVNTTGTYFVTITDGNTCTATNDVDITVNANPVIDLGINQTICVDAVPVTLDAGAGFIYLWTGGSTNQTLDVSTTGTYSVTISDGNSCTASDDIDITVNANPVVDLGADFTICADAVPVTLDAGTGFTYLWTGSTTNQTLDVFSTGTYSVTITDGNNCTATDQSVITIISSPLPNILGDTTFCDGSFTTLNAGSGYSGYSWSTTETSQSIDVNSSGMFSVTVSDVNGCTGSDSVFVTMETIPTVNVVDLFNVCKISSFAVENSTILNYSYIQWTTNGSGTFSDNSVLIPDYIPTQTDLDNGSVNLILNAYSSCGAFSDTMHVVFYNNPEISTGFDTTINSGTSIAMYANGGISYAWSPVDYLSCTTCANPVSTPYANITYTVVGTDINGCMGSDDITINIDLSQDIFIPSAFSPNGDGQNDVLFVRGKGIKTLTFIVFDRWGEKVYETASTEYGWDGTYRGKELDPGVFVYYVVVTFNDDTTYKNQGNVTLVR